MCHKMCNFFTFFPLYISYGLQLVHSKQTKQSSPLIFFNNCISAQVIHYSLQPSLCNLTSEMLAIKACTCNNEKSILYYYSIKMCMNLRSFSLSG
uniref:Secreted protein n=1 Tax=Pelusios castaneus TaxID=367368 RepID=A0A8C8R9J7_9SAUR